MNSLKTLQLKVIIIFMLFTLANSNMLIASQWTNSNIPDSTIIAPIIFSQNMGKYLYRAQIELPENTLTGMLLIKKSADSSYRIAFVTEVGMSVFEMEFFPNKQNSFILHSCLSYLNKKVVINTLRRDFESIFLNFTAWETPNITQDNQQYIFKYCQPFGDGKRLYTTNGFGDVTQIMRKKFGFTKEITQIENIKNPYPQSIIIAHQNNKLKISLTFIK